jgi:hypothetical protein
MNLNGFNGASVTVRRAARPWRELLAEAAHYARNALDARRTDLPEDIVEDWRGLACKSLGEAVAAFREQGR